MRRKSWTACSWTCERKPWELLRWVKTERSLPSLTDIIRYRGQLATDDRDNLVALFPNRGNLDRFAAEFQDVHLFDSPLKLRANQGDRQTP